MMGILLNFLQFLTARDRTKWYTFSVFDICLFLFTGVMYFVSNSDSPTIAWILIIGMNVIETYYHNKNNKDSANKSSSN